MTAQDCLEKFCYGIPKAELHLHLEGTLEPDLKLKLAERNGVDIGQKTFEEVSASYDFNDLPSFLAVYYTGMSVLQKEEDFYELAWAYLERAKEHGVKHVEAFFDPQAHTTRGISFETVLNGYYRAISNAGELGIDASLIMCFLRDMSAESAEEHLEMALPYKDKIIGIGLDSDEKGNPPVKFEKVFKKAKEEGFRLTMHCDVDQENSIEHIRQVLEEIGVERIDHGTNILENPKLVEYVVEKGIGLTSCPLSNGLVSDSMKGDKVKELLDHKVKMTINSDDPAYFGGYVGKNLYEVSKAYHFSKEEIITLAKNSFEISWLTDEQKAEYIKQIDDFVAEHKNCGA